MVGKPVDLDDVKCLDPDFYRQRVWSSECGKSQQLCFSECHRRHRNIDIQVAPLLRPGGLSEVEAALGEPLTFVFGAQRCWTNIIRFQVLIWHIIRFDWGRHLQSCGLLRWVEEKSCATCVEKELGIGCWFGFPQQNCCKHINANASFPLGKIPTTGGFFSQPCWITSRISSPAVPSKWWPRITWTGKFRMPLLNAV